jgi:hypothetical protein
MQIVHTDKLNTADWVWYMTDPSSRQREHPTSTSLQLSDSNKDALFQDGLADWTVGRNINLTLTLTLTTTKHPCGGRFEFPHRDPASRRRRRKGKSQIWDSKIWSQVPRNSDPRLYWRGPAAYRKDRPVLSSERAPHENRTVTVKK